MDNNERLFHSESSNLTIHLCVRDERGKIIKRKRATFVKGIYYAQTEDYSFLEVDELPLMRKHPDYNIRFFDESGWAERAMTKLNDSEKTTIKSMAKHKDDEIAKLKEKLAELEKVNKTPVYDDSDFIEDEKEDEIEESKIEHDKPKPASKSKSTRGRKKQNG